MFIRHFVVGLTCAFALCMLSLATKSSCAQDSTPAKAEESAQPPAESKADAPPAKEAADKDAADKDAADKDAATEGAKSSDDAAHEKPEGETHKDGESHEGKEEHKGKTEHGGGDKAEHGADGEAGHGEEGHEEGDHGGAHAPEPGHGNATGALTKAEEVRSDMAIYSLVVFLLLLAILYRFAWGPIVEGLDKREEAVAANIQQASDNAAKSEELVREHEARLADAAEETKKIIDKAKADAERSAQRIVEEAEAAAARQRERAIADIENAKTTALAEVSEKSVDIALGLAGGIVSKNLDRDQHAELIRDALEQFPSQN